ncbi:MAG: aminopeptidase P family protein [Rhodospirillaceae bacterium]|nr:aminopeptidase P family protein [Rhodospirillaceae bacterium]
MRAYRLGRFRAELAKRDLCGALLFDPLNIRYATGSRNMAVWTMHNVARYAFVPTEGPITLFDFHGCAHLSAHLETIAEVRPALTWMFFYAGERAPERARRWAAEIADLVRGCGGANGRLAVDRLDPLPAAALTAHGIELHDAQEPIELARAIKSADEIACMSASIAVCEAGMARMREALRPGLSENALWAILHETNIALGGEWIETRLLASGGRTNPWFQESSDRLIRAGELVSFDTDLIGPFGYCADISRTYFCGPGRPSDEQRRLYGLAMEQIHHNLALLRPGVGFRELAERAWKLPESVRPNRYASVLHGVGLADEYPHCPYPEDFDRTGYDGVLQPGMTVCLESYIGEVGGSEGVKLEQQVLITETGAELLSTFPFEDALLPSRWV